MPDFLRENLCHDPIHGYIPFTSSIGLARREASERDLIDTPWVQRMRQIHQLQTAWWVYPSAEHTRFQHVLGVMHLGSRAVRHLYPSLREVCPDAPSEGYVHSLVRLAGLLHDVGHGPFGHFFDEHCLKQFGLTHESLGAKIIVEELGEWIRAVRRNPYGTLAPDEQLDPEQIAWLIQRPRSDEDLKPRPRWLIFLRSLMSGIYTIDNMDFVLRDAYMSGYSRNAYDLERLLHYTFFSDRGLTIHHRGLGALVRFMSVRAELFRTIYFHRTVRAIDLTLKDLFPESRPFLLPGNPADDLEAYRRLTEFSLLVDVTRWPDSEDPKQRALGERWVNLLGRKVPWVLACEKLLVFAHNDAEQQSKFSRPEFVEQELRERLPENVAREPLRVDIARHIYRPDSSGPATGQNFLFDGHRGVVRPLTDDQLFRQLPISNRICRVYAGAADHSAVIAKALESLAGGAAQDDLTNM